MIEPRSAREAAHPEDKSDPQILGMYCRIAAEIGADLVKCIYPGSTQAMAQVIDGCPAPVLVAGGSRAASTQDAYQRAESAIAAGAAGLVFGRNIYECADPALELERYRQIVQSPPTPMILTVTPNIALDRLVVVHGFQPGQQSRAQSGFYPGGRFRRPRFAYHSILGRRQPGYRLPGRAYRGSVAGSRSPGRLELPGCADRRETRQSYCIIDPQQGSQVESVEAGPPARPPTWSA